MSTNYEQPANMTTIGMGPGPDTLVQDPAGETEKPLLAADGDTEPGAGLRALPDHLQKRLLELVRKYQTETERERREQLKRSLQLHEFFRGNQYGWWDWTTGTYRQTTTGVGATQTPMNDQELRTLNVFQGYALSMIALLAGNPMPVKAHPANAQNPNDVKVAKKGDVVLRAFDKYERTFSQLTKEVYHLWCDGTFGSYVRTVVDKNRFGTHKEPITQMVPTPMGPGSYGCAVCGDQFSDNNGGQCPYCGGALPPEPNIPAPQVPMPTVTGYKDVPNGRTVRTVVPGLELCLPPWCDEQWDFPYIIREREIDKADARATYPEIANKIGSSQPTPVDEMAAASYGRRARMQAESGLSPDGKPIMGSQGDRITFREAWLRPKAFYRLDEKEDRDQLLQMFPDGVYVAFADNQFCEARPESMDDHWRVCHALPGRGQIREPIGGSLVQIQEILNDLVNIVRDLIEYGMSTTFVDTEMLDPKELEKQNVVAGAFIGVNRRGDVGVNSGFFQTQPAQPPPFATTFIEELRTTWAQFATGAFPAAYGGGQPGNPTAQGQAMVRDAALGRVSIYLKALREHHAALGPLIIKDFKGNALMPLVVVDSAIGGGYTQEIVSPEDLAQGELQMTFEVNEDYPTTWAQQQALVLQMMSGPLAPGMLSLLKNIPRLKHVLGFDLELPGEEAYAREQQVIEQLLQEAPVPGPMQPVMVPGQDPMTGAPTMVPAIDEATGQPQMQPGPPQASVPINPLDDNPAMFQADTDFYFSPQGAAAQKTNPQGWQNFLLHAQERQAAMAQPPMPGPGAAAPGSSPSAQPPAQGAGNTPGAPPV